MWRRRWVRVLAWVGLAFVALAVVIRVALDPVATHYTRKALRELPEHSGQVGRVHVALFPPAYELWQLELSERSSSNAEAKKRPHLLYVEHARARLLGGPLLHGRLVAALRIDHPKITIVKRAPSRPQKPKPAPDVREALAEQKPGRIERIEIRDGEIAFRDLTSENDPTIWVHGLEVAVENLATRPALSGARPTTVSASGVMAKTGRLTLFASADPFDEGLTFAGRFGLRGLRTGELFELVEGKTKMHAPEGIVDVTAEFVADDGAITGGVKPVLRNVSIRASEGGWLNRLKASVADETLDLFSDRVPERNAVATVIPIKGQVTDPKAQIWPTVLGVVRNAFVEGVRGGFAHLPPETAAKPEGVVKQATEALDKDKGPPKAQPEKSRS